MTRFNGGFTGFMQHTYTDILRHIITSTYSNLISSSFSFPKQTSIQMFFTCFFSLVASLCLLILCRFILKAKQRNRKQKEEEEEEEKQEQTRRVDSVSEPEQPVEAESATELTRPLLLEIFPSNSLRWDRLFEEGEPDSSEPGLGSDRVGKKKKRRAKKKSSDLKDEEEGETKRKEEDILGLYPFTSSSSGTQRKIKQQYDEIMKHHRTKQLTFPQVAHFAHCLVEAKTELQHKDDMIQRKFTIKKALLLKADKSSFERLRQQVYKLELEQKRLEEDAFVYNWLQQQLKLSSAYKKMLEIGARMELKAKSGELKESSDSEYSSISFEELLAQEKKDSFWQRNGKLRPCTN